MGLKNQSHAMYYTNTAECDCTRMLYYTQLHVQITVAEALIYSYRPQNLQTLTGQPHSLQTLQSLLFSC